MLIENVKLDYVHLEEPYGGKYSITVIVSKDDKKALEEIEKAISEAREFLGNSKSLILPLRDGDLERSGNVKYKNSYFFVASSLYKIFKSSAKGINKVLIDFYPFTNQYNRKGVACLLRGVEFA